MQGKANLRQAEQEKMIMIETAKAEKEAAVQRAEAIRIMGEAAKEFVGEALMRAPDKSQRVAEFKAMPSA